VKALVPDTDSNAPPAPRGIVLNHNVLFVPSLSGVTGSIGELQAFNGTTGAFRGLLLPPAGLASSFHPRGVVIGPDGLLYVSNDPVLGGNGGHILRYDPATQNFKDIFVSNDVCNCDFNRPEGLVFGPDGNLYVTSFQASSSDTDKILIFAGPFSRKPGAFLAKIDLDQVGDDRAYAQALLFGPEGRLFVPITGAYTGRYAGQVRRYNVNDLNDIRFDIFVPSGLIQNPGPSWWYLTFGNTDPATLNYMSPYMSPE
jgi:DNA-binding beta-propeller fold protein YncE